MKFKNLEMSALCTTFFDKSTKVPQKSYRVFNSWFKKNENIVKIVLGVENA